MLQCLWGLVEICVVRRLICKKDKVVGGLEENVLASLKLMSKLLLSLKTCFHVADLG